MQTISTKSKTELNVLSFCIFQFILFEWKLAAGASLKLVPIYVSQLSFTHFWSK